MEFILCFYCTTSFYNIFLKFLVLLTFLFIFYILLCINGSRVVWIILVVSMPPKQVAYCRSCNFNHARPVGRNCRRTPGAGATSNPSIHNAPVQNTVPVTATLSHVGAPSVENLNATQATHSNATNSNINPQVADRLLAKLDSVVEKIDSIDRRVASNERALADRAPGSQKTQQQDTRT